MKADAVSIVIPALNEGASVGAVVAGLRAAFSDAEVIVVNDGSTDDTARLAAAAGGQVVSHTRCRGYGASLRTGTETATRDYVLFCDADGQHTAEDVGRLIEGCEGYDMVVGVRGRDSHAPLLRRPGKFVLTRFADYLAGEKIPDLNSGLRIVRKELLKKYMHLMPQGFSFSTTSTFALLKTNRRVGWIPITVQKRTGHSTVRQLRHGPQMLMLMLRLTVLFEPLKVFMAVTRFLLVLTLVSMATDVFVTQKAGLGDTTVILSIATLITFMFGLLCDQVSALRRELHE